MLSFLLFPHGMIQVGKDLQQIPIPHSKNFSLDREHLSLIPGFFQPHLGLFQGWGNQEFSGNSIGIPFQGLAALNTSFVTSEIWVDFPPFPQVWDRFCLFHEFLKPILTTRKWFPGLGSPIFSKIYGFLLKWTEIFALFGIKPNCSGGGEKSIKCKIWTFSPKFFTLFHITAQGGCHPLGLVLHSKKNFL